VEDAYLPARQFTQTDAPAAEYDPVLQTEHDPSPEDAAIFPAAQLAHAAAPADEYFPRLHVPVADKSPDEAQYDPAGHETQAPDPVADANVPAAHMEQEEAPGLEKRPAAQLEQEDGLVTDAYRPALHAEQLDAPAFEYCPLAQLPVGCDSPVDPQK
jgi:hypothetical protein